MEIDPAALFPSVANASKQDLLRLSRRRGIQRCRRIVERCLDLTPSEVGHRLARLFAGDAPALERFGGTAPSFDAAVTALDTRFLVGMSTRKRLLASAAGDERLLRGIETAARGLLANGMTVFGETVALDPATFDWQRDPRTGRRLWANTSLNESSAVAATRAPDGKILTDVKYVWEVNRHQPLTTVAVAFQLTRDERLRAYIEAVLSGWIGQNEPGHGVNWSSVLEVGVRAISWLWTMGYVLDAMDPRGIAARWLASLADHYEFLRRNLSVYTDRSNHLIGEATALWLLSAVFADLPDAARERLRAEKILAVEIERQVTADGVSREQAIGYHCFVLDFYLQVIAVAHAQGITLAPIIESRVAGMLEFLRRLLGAGGALPQIGDGDDGIGWPYPFPLETRGRAATLLAIGGELFGRDDWRATDGLPRLVAHAVLGTMPPRAPLHAARADTSSILLAEGGYCFLEATTAGEHRQLVFDVGGLGYLPNAAHEHADALSILVRINETLVLGDPGTGTYTGSAALRDGFRSTASHNTLTIDDLNQADVLDTFKWINCFRTVVLGFEAGPHLDYVGALHEGFTRMRERMRHSREILFVRPDYWVLVDRVAGTGRHAIARRFHLPPGVTAFRSGPATFMVTSADTGDGIRLDFPALGDEPVTAVAEASPWSSGYGRCEVSSRIVVHDRIETAGLLLTLITPIRHGQPVMEITDGGDDLVCRMRGAQAPTREDRIMRDEGGSVTFATRVEGTDVRRTLGSPDAWNARRPSHPQ